jgi:phenylacetate-CoA oxygenase PaaH subunit
MMPDSPDLGGVFEVFAQFGLGKSIGHVGSVRAKDPVLAWQFARETYTRREDCTLLWVVPRSSIQDSDGGSPPMLGNGLGRRYRLSAYPSSHRRARSRVRDGSDDVIEADHA